MAKRLVDKEIAKFDSVDAVRVNIESTDTSNGYLPVESQNNGHVCEDNSTVTPILASAVFTGVWQDTLNYNTVTVGIISDQDSATDGLSVDWSADGVTKTQDDVFSILADSGKVFTFSPANRYMRIVYTNGAVDQTLFNIQTIFKKGGFKPSSHRINDNIVADDDATLNKAVITGQNPNGTFVNIGTTLNDNLHVSVQEYGDTPAIDAFDRLRTSEPFTIFDSKQLHDKQPLFWDESLGGSATSFHSPADANTVMTVTANAADFVIRQTKQRFNYQPGKSQLIFMTLHSSQVSGITARIGAFDGTGTNNLTPNNGIFFEGDGTLSWNIAKDGTTEETIAQGNWNVDKLDGTGASGITLDMSATQILVVDYEWLGVGRVRVGFVISGLIYYCHYFNHANDSTFDSVYMSTPNLPIRYSIETDGTNGSTLDHICSTVMSEGGIEKTGVLRATDNGGAFVTGLAAATDHAIVGIRLKSAYKDVTVIPEGLSVIAGTNDSFRWSVQINPTINGTFTYSDKTDSAVQEATGTASNTLSAVGLIVGSGYASTSARQVDTALNTALRIGSTIAGVQDELVLVITPITSNMSVACSLNYRELL